MSLPPCPVCNSKLAHQDQSGKDHQLSCKVDGEMMMTTLFVKKAYRL